MRIMLGFRFVYGMRTITPLILGMDGTIRVRRFILLNLIGAAIWSTVIATGGYFFGRVLKIFLTDIKHYELGLLLVVLLIGGTVRLVAVHRARRKS